VKSLFILSALLIFLYSGAFAQSNNSITMKNGFFGWQFYQNHQKLKLGEVVTLMEPNPQAHGYIKTARANNTWASVVN